MPTIYYNRNWQFIQDFNFVAMHGAELQNHPTYVALKQHIQNDETDVLLTAVLDRSLWHVSKTPQVDRHTIGNIRSPKFRT